MSPHLNKKCIFSFLLLCTGLSIIGLNHNVFASAPIYQTGDVSAHPSFADGVFYEMVVDSYNYQKEVTEGGKSATDFWNDYDAVAERQKILTTEELASVKFADGFGCHPQASKTATVSSISGIELLTNLESLSFSTCPVNVDEFNLSRNVKLKEFDIQVYNLETIDFSKNTELEKVTIRFNDIKNLDFSNNHKLNELYIFNELELTDIDLSGIRSMSVLSILDTPKLNDLNLGYTGLEKLELTGQLDGEIYANKSITINPSSEIRLKMSDGKGAGDSDARDGFKDSLILDISSNVMDFVRNNNSNINGTLENETFLAKDPTCYSYDSNSKIITVNKECIDEGLSAATLIHKYAIGSQEYTNEFSITFNPVYVFVETIIDGESAGPILGVSDKLYIGQEFDTEKYILEPERSGIIIAKEKGAELIKTEVAAFNDTAIMNKPQTVPLEIFTTSTELRKKGVIASSDTNQLKITYYFKTPAPKTPNTGFFTNEDGSLNVSNTLLSLAGVSILAFTVLYLRNRISRRKEARRF